MAQKFIAISIFVCVLATFAYSAPQFNHNPFLSQPSSGNPLAPQTYVQPQVQPQVQPRVQSQVLPHEPERNSRFLVANEKFHQDPNGEYNFAQQFVSGEQFSEEGKLKNVNDQDVIVTKGSYTILEKDGSMTIVNYTADENGFHPEIIPGVKA